MAERITPDQELVDRIKRDGRKTGENEYILPDNYGTEVIVLQAGSPRDPTKDLGVLGVDIVHDLLLRTEQQIDEVIQGEDNVVYSAINETDDQKTERGRTTTPSKTGRKIIEVWINQNRSLDYVAGAFISVLDGVELHSEIITDPDLLRRIGDSPQYYYRSFVD